jgi:RNA polymerase sigma-B factor
MRREDGRFAARSAAERSRADRLLLQRWQRDGDAAAREELIRRLLPLARRMARRYSRSDDSLEDLVQVAVLGLVKAIDRFDATRATAFSSYAVPTMLGELKRHFRDHGWALHVPRGMQERVMAVDATMRDLGRSLGRVPSADEVSRECGLTVEEVLEAFEAATAYEAVSLDGYRYAESDGGETYADRVGTEDGRYDLVEYEATIAPVLRALPERERRILHLRFAEDLTQAEIAERIGVSQMHVSRLLRRAIDRLQAVARHGAA